jgi:hypothetical protein
MVEQLCAQAESEIASGEPGYAIDRLHSLIERVRKEWGERRPLVRRVWQGAADGFRLSGNFGAAARLYQAIDNDLMHGDGPAERADRALIRLRTAECQLTFGELEAAIAAVDTAGHTAAGLPPELGARVEAVRRAVDAQLTARLAEPRHREG